MGNSTGLSFSGGGALLTAGNNMVQQRRALRAGRTATGRKETFESAAFGRPLFWATRARDVCYCGG
jgi:hypothetical protein